jgi:hypothetical protein
MVDVRTRQTRGVHGVKPQVPLKGDGGVTISIDQETLMGHQASEEEEEEHAKYRCDV